MVVPSAFLHLSGRWTGIHRLWFLESDPVRVSHSMAEISMAAQGHFLVIRYTWDFEDKPQDGLLVVGQAENSPQLSACWIDSWHMHNKIMNCHGEIAGNDEIRLTGSYADPPGPDWGWRIIIRVAGMDTWQMTMHNVSPDGVETLAVQADYERQTSLHKVDE